MLIIPAIDIKDGHCVRLQEGVMSTATVFSDNPGETATKWKSLGAKRLHVVDLNGAVAGKPKNEGVVKDIIAAMRAGDEEVPIQLGGGIRDLDTIERYLDDGITWIVIGTAAVKSPGFLQEACDAFPGHIIVALDAKMARWRSMAGPNSRGTMWSTWPSGSRIMASRRCCAPTSVATWPKPFSIG